MNADDTTVDDLGRREKNRAATLSGSGIPRSLLFTPGTKSAHFGAAARVGADAMILDLEDSVAPRDKDRARRDVLEYLAAGSRTPGAEHADPLVIVRINPPDTVAGWHDVTALLDAPGSAPEYVLVPKAHSAAVLATLRTVLHRAGTRVGILALYESAVVAADPARLLDPAVVDGVLFGEADMSADLGAAADAAVTGYVRDVLLTHAAAAGIPVFDSPSFDVGDTADGADALAVAARTAAARGFAGKAAIHPRQVQAVNAAFTAAPEDIAWARKVLATNEEGVGTVDGAMVDEAVARRARRILSTVR